MEEDETTRTPATTQPKRRSKGKDAHQCKVCGESFSRASALVEHLWVHTGEKPFSCDQCGCRFNALASLHKHQRMKHDVKLDADDRPFKCDQCGSGFACKRNLVKHQRRKRHIAKHEEEEIAVVMIDAPQNLPNTDEGPLQSGQREDSSPSNFSLQRSAMYWTSKGGFDKECDQCGKRFQNMTRLSVHMRIHEGKKNHKCKFCDAEYIWKSHLKTHERVHTGERPFKCDLCGEGFREGWRLSTHKRNFHKENVPYSKMYMCLQCRSKFPSRQQLQTHKAQCSRSRKARIKMHQRTCDAKKDQNAGDQSAKVMTDATPAPFRTPSTGDGSGKGVVSKQRLLKHQDLHEGRKTAKCSNSGKDFISYKAPKDHENAHTGERPYSCDYCDRTSATLEDMRSHQLIRHLGKKLSYSKQSDLSSSPGFLSQQKDDAAKQEKHINKPHKCDVCGYGFVRELLLQKHQKNCGKSVFSCRFCGETFPCRAQHLAHQRRFHNNELHECKHCDKIFSHSISLRTHEKSHTNKTSRKTQKGGEKSTNKLKREKQKTTNIKTKYSRDHCEGSFADPSGLAFHKCNDQSPGKTLTCKDCGTVVKVGGTNVSNVFTVTDPSTVNCFINNHTLF